MIKIKNSKIFTVPRSHKCHWSKLPKMIKIMNTRILDLSEADLRGADLCRANLCEADLSEANLSEADLSEADLSEADLRRAKNIKDIEYFYNMNICSTRFNYQVLHQSQIGSNGRSTTYIPELDIVWCGCWKGTMKQFKAKIIEVYGSDKQNKYYIQYMDLIKYFTK
jgi:hypothetical protein